MTSDRCPHGRTNGRRRRRTRAAAGLTLVEVLVTLAVASLLLAAVSGVLVGANAAGAAEERATEPWRALDLAAELLAEEAGLAGHAPYPLADDTGPGPDVTLTGSASGHVIQARFVDDRLAGPPVARELRFEARVDAGGAPQLYRTAGSASRQPLVAGVAGLRVDWVVTGSGDLVAPVPGAAYPEARALVLSLSAAQGEARTAVVLLAARPTVAVAP